MLGLRDDEVAATPPHGPSLAQDRRHDVLGLLDATLRLRHRLLRDDEDVPFLEPARALGGVAEERGEVVPGPHLGQPGERDDREH